MTALELATAVAVIGAAEAVVSSPPPSGNLEAKGMIVLAQPRERQNLHSEYFEGMLHLALSTADWEFASADIVAAALPNALAVRKTGVAAESARWSMYQKLDECCIQFAMGGRILIETCFQEAEANVSIFQAPGAARASRLGIAGSRDWVVGKRVWNSTPTRMARALGRERGSILQMEVVVTQRGDSDVGLT